jgi:ABC-2 type transport system permease protein
MTGQTDSLPLERPASRGRRRKRVYSPGTPDSRPVQPTARATDTEPPLRAGWRIVAAKELADHLTSVRFIVLTVILGLAAAAAVYSAAGGIRDLASAASGTPSLFLNLFTFRPEGSQIPNFIFFVTFLAPLLGIAFGFDAVNGERSEGTLPRLVSQPIHRDDIINGKFVAGLAAIAIIFIIITSLVAAVGVLLLGILPSAEEVLRLMVWMVLAIAYVGLWLALALACSIVFRRAATSALVAIAIWLMLTLFASLLVGIFAGFLSPVGQDATSAEQIANATMQQNLARLSPTQLFTEATRALLDPGVQTFDIAALVQINAEQRAIPTLLSFEQSLLVIWPQFVALIAAMVVIFALAYIAFMRQEVRA